MLLIRINSGEKVVTQIACHISVILDGIQMENTYSSIHGVKGETFDALMLLIHGTVGNTLTPSFLANGKTNTELMRIAYVAMTRPRKLLVVAMPKNKAKLSNRFPPDKWDYVEL